MRCPVNHHLGAAKTPLAHTINGCAMAQILEMAAIAAGAELTNDSFGAALASLGEFEMAGFPPAALGPDDTDAAYEFVD